MGELYLEFVGGFVQNFIGCLYGMYRVVEYATYDDMKNAMRKLDGAELNGRKLKLTEDYRGRKRRLVISYTSDNTIP